MREKIIKDLWKLIISLLICQAAGIIGSFFTAQSVTTWYLDMRKPFFTPPNYIFAPVWFLLYLLMGIAFFLVWRIKMDPSKLRAAFAIFITQLLLNSTWSIAFFGFKSPMAGLIVIVALWLAICYTIIIFRKISLTAAMLLIPYILWVSFAVFLNGAIFVLNK
ncbi:MAG: tryptophan-rich sensory protein [Candidatus Omnitrophica bacterium]|nr:tryptophan-rich sensory protein [Candidatus Omnitrophota bacterium]